MRTSVRPDRCGRPVEPARRTRPDARVTPPWFALESGPHHRSTEPSDTVEQVAITITTRGHGRRQRPTTPAAPRPPSPPAARRAATARRLLASAPRRRRRSAVGLVLVMAQAGAALGGPPSPLPSAARHVASTDVDRRSPATRCGRSRERLAPGDDPRPVVDALAQPATAPRSCRARRSSGTGNARRDRPRRPGTRRGAGPPWLRSAPAAMRGGPERRYGGVVRCPYCRANDDKVVDSRPAEEAAAIRRRRECLGCGRRFTTYERVEELPLVVVQALGRDRAVRRREAAGRDRARGRGQRARRRPRSTRWSPRSRRSCGRSGAEVTERPGRAGRARAAAGARPGRRTCGSRRSTRASRTSPTSSARSASCRRRPRPKRRSRTSRPASGRSDGPRGNALQLTRCGIYSDVMHLHLAVGDGTQPQHLVVSARTTIDSAATSPERAREGESTDMAMAPEQLGIGIRRHFTRPGRRTRTTPSSGSGARRGSRTTRTAATPSSSPTSSSRRRGR